MVAVPVAVRVAVVPCVRRREFLLSAAADDDDGGTPTHPRTRPICVVLGVDVDDTRSQRVASMGLETAMDMEPSRRR